jgi:hypothetical protein
MNKQFIRCDDKVTINGEEFSVEDVCGVFPEYDSSHKVHYYDGKKHYRSDGRTQIGFSTPYELGERMFESLVRIKACKTQRETDKRHLEYLRNARR